MVCLFGGSTMWYSGCVVVWYSGSEWWLGVVVN